MFLENQVNHTFRHIEAAGINRQAVQEAIEARSGFKKLDSVISDNLV
jgi:hypothetical protein